MYEISDLLGGSSSESEHEGGASPRKTKGVPRKEWGDIQPGGVWRYVKAKDGKTMSGTMTANTGTMFSFSSDPSNPNAFRTNINHDNVKSLELIRDASPPSPPEPSPLAANAPPPDNVQSAFRSFSPVKEVNLNFNNDLDGKLRQLLDKPPPSDPGLRSDIEDLRRDVEIMREDLKALHKVVREIADRA